MITGFTRYFGRRLIGLKDYKIFIHMYNYTYVCQVWLSIVIKHLIALPLPLPVFTCSLTKHIYTHAYACRHADGQTIEQPQTRIHEKREVTACVLFVLYLRIIIPKWTLFCIRQCTIIYTWSRSLKSFFFLYFFYVVCSTSFYVSVCILSILYAP